MFTLQLENKDHSVIDINDGINYAVIGISGLNPPTAEIFTSKSPNRKGSKYNGSTLNERNIVIQIEFKGDIEKNRNDLYSWIDTEQYIKVLYSNGVKDVYSEGYVQDCEIDFFAEKEIAIISILCTNPYWITRTPTSVSLSQTVSSFVFPFAINVNGIPFSTVTENASVTINNSGAETGARFIINCENSVTGFALYDVTNAARQFVINTTLGAGWIVVIDTDSSPKTVKAYLPNNTTINLLQYIYNPTWFTIKRGANVFGYSATNGGENVDMTISYQDKCLGV